MFRGGISANKIMQQYTDLNDEFQFDSSKISPMTSLRFL